jgi:hypothetical protein
MESVFLDYHTLHHLTHIRGIIQNIPDCCHHIFSAKHRFQQGKLWIPCSTARFCGDCVNTCEDVAPTFGENRPGYFTMTMPRLTLPSSSSSFWLNTKWLKSPTHRTPMIWLPVTFLFPKMKLKLKGRRFDTIEDIQAESPSAWRLDRNGFPGSVPEMEETAEPVSTCGRALLIWYIWCDILKCNWVDNPWQ